MKKEFVIPDDMDVECMALCYALNTIECVETIEACCGHGLRPYRIWFKAAPVALKHVAYYADRCHSGYSGWSVTVTTDCSRRPVTYLLEGPCGSIAYKAAAILADAILADEQIDHEEWEGNIGLPGNLVELNAKIAAEQDYANEELMREYSLEHALAGLNDGDVLCFYEYDLKDKTTTLHEGHVKNLDDASFELVIQGRFLNYTFFRTGPLAGIAIAGHTVVARVSFDASGLDIGDTLDLNQMKAQSELLQKARKK